MVCKSQHYAVLLAVIVYLVLGGNSPYKRVCYYSGGDYSLPVKVLNLTVCTHVIFYGVEFNISTFKFYWASKSDAQAVEDLKQLRQQYHFKLMAVKGSNLIDIVNSQANMTRFANSIVDFFRTNQLDGIDFDWEFPTGKYKKLYAQLMKTIRTVFDSAGSPKLLLSMAASGVGFFIVDSYDIPSLSKSFDFIDIMGYDYRDWEDQFYLTAHHSPLYASQHDTIYFNTLNLNWSAMFFANSGFPKEKINLGLPAYSHSYELWNSEEHGLYAPAKREANPPSMEYPEICQFVKLNGTVRVWDNYAQSPYAYNGNRWYCFDDFQSLDVKVNYLKEHGFGGVMVWSLNSDYDPEGKCETGTRFPIHSRLYDLIVGD